MKTYAAAVRAPEFPEGLTWVNSSPVRLADLRGKLVILDFWTAGCINCIHELPHLAQLERKYREDLVVIGVQSAKYLAEGDPHNLANAVQRYAIEHPVVNDLDYQIWSAYGVRAWPTLIFISPEGRVIGEQAGEIPFEELDRLLAAETAEYSQNGSLRTGPSPVQTSSVQRPSSVLSFPGKVLAGGDRVFIADSGHHRIILCDREGAVQRVVGAGEPGLVDGDPASARFNRPQGMVQLGDTLYVADADNHAIRSIDLATGEVRTCAGTGSQANRAVRSGPARETALSSPWDLASAEGKLFIAMAGLHQVWVFDPVQDTVAVWAGTGHEALRDGPRETAWLAQPTGLDSDGDALYVSCAEAQAVRRIEFGSGETSTLVGTGLFDFGDQDGPAAAALLQHNQDVAAAGELVYVADTYNDKIKLVDRSSKSVTTYAGSGENGWLDGPGEHARFDQPSGLSRDGETLWVADTNNHLIRAIDLTSGHVRTLAVHGLGLDVRSA